MIPPPQRVCVCNGLARPACRADEDEAVLAWDRHPDNGTLWQYDSTQAWETNKVYRRYKRYLLKKNDQYQSFTDNGKGTLLFSLDLSAAFRTTV